jgi:AraC-like DNA-binding protein
MGVNLKQDAGSANGYLRGDTVVLSDPARPNGVHSMGQAPSDTVTFWADPSCEGLEAAAARFKKHCFRPHTHDGLMIGLIDFGAKSFMRQRSQYVAEPGSISVVNAGDLHTGSRAHGEELRYRALYVPVSILADAAGSASAGDPPGFRSGVIRDQRLFSALCRMHASIIDGSSRLKREQLLLDAVHILAGTYGSAWKPRDKSIADAPGPIRAAYALIEAQFKEDISVSDVAMAVEISPYHLMRLFRRHVGIPIHALQTQLRVESGKRLLRQGMAASEAALEVGFADQSHFTKRFKELVGTSPVAYQRNMQPDPAFGRARASSGLRRK